LTGRGCVECGLAAVDAEQACRVCGGFVVAPPWWAEAEGVTVALPPAALGLRADDSAGGSGDIRVSDVLRVGFRPGPYEVELRRGDDVLLGRDAVLSGHAGFLRRFDDVSRRHATLRLDAEGRAFIRDEYSTNWTVRNGSRLVPGAECRLRDGDRIRLGAVLCGLVQLVASADGRSCPPNRVDGTPTRAEPVRPDD